ncbi:MAG TPA: hypothetical protein VKU40_18290 [Thermoanaerobaculia bacterium]|nr:hypothetical protein [Thermoanaerobaculia bacterium]
MNDDLPPDTTPEPTSDDTLDEAADHSPDANPGALAPRPPAAHERKPGKVTALAVINLAQGILSTCYAVWLVFFFLVFALGSAGCGCVFVPLAVFPLVVGILAIVHATKLLPEPPQAVAPAHWLAVLQMCTLLFGDVVSFAAGVAHLVLLNDSEVSAWFARNQPKPLV